MERREFFELIQPLGEFRCTQDLRRFKYRAKKKPHWTLNQYLSHFGQCLEGQYHHCDFALDKASVTQIQVVGYQRMAQRGGLAVRIKSNAFTYWGRGRRWNTPRKKK